MERIQASERTREKLKALMAGRSEARDGRSELVRLAARLIIEEALEGEAGDALGRDYYARGAAPGAGYRNGCRTGRLKTAEGAVMVPTRRSAQRPSAREAPAPAAATPRSRARFVATSAAHRFRPPLAVRRNGWRLRGSRPCHTASSSNERRARCRGRGSPARCPLLQFL